jgi:hypothetical protein
MSTAPPKANQPGRRWPWALLLAVYYDLSDVKLAEALEDRASFRLLWVLPPIR